MIIKTETELVRYIRHHIAGSEYLDVQAVKEFVNMRLRERLQRLSELLENVAIPYDRHEEVRRLLDQKHDA